VMPGKNELEHMCKEAVMVCDFVATVTLSDFRDSRAFDNY
jgi:2-hydroxy-3-keto-5-methylthiopentenyl-1-phosphate phosphatase